MNPPAIIMDYKEGGVFTKTQIKFLNFNQIATSRIMYKWKRLKS